MPLAAQEQPTTTPAAAPASSLDSALTPETLWNTPAQEWLAQHATANGLRWVSAAQTSIQSTSKSATLYGLPVYQTLVQVENEKPVKATILFYNRGDAGLIDRDQFSNLIQRVQVGISNATGTTPKARGRDRTSAVRAEGYQWSTPQAEYLLEYSFVREDKGRGIPFRGEFIRLEITPFQAPLSLMAEAQKARENQGPFKGSDHVTRDAASGDVFLADIPMVDQGAKGYCVVASAERVLQYYGIRADSHELAQLADASASEGTSVEAMTNSLKTLAARLRIRTRSHITLEVRSFLELVKEYNLVAKRAKKPELKVGGYRINIAEIYNSMDPEVLREARTRRKSGITSFQRQITTHIDKGVPLLWSVMLGVIPEEKYTPQSAGGHMRLIIGYNTKTEELIFSDSWGHGHEAKRMPLADGWAVTTGLATIEPL